MNERVALLTEDQRAVLTAAVHVAEELLAPTGRAHDASVIRAAAGCGPAQAVRDRAFVLMTGLRDQCLAQSARDFWLGEFDAHEVDNPDGMVAELAATRAVQASLLAAALAVLSGDQQPVVAA